MPDGIWDEAEDVKLVGSGCEVGRWAISGLKALKGCNFFCLYSHISIGMTTNKGFDDAKAHFKGSFECLRELAGFAEAVVKMMGKRLRENVMPFWSKVFLLLLGK